MSGKEPKIVLSIIIPTYNEKENLPRLVKQIFAVLGKIRAQVVVVDDNSPDGTGETAESLKKTYAADVVHRSGKSGLASAVLDGLKAAQGDFICVMDADLSHDPSILPLLVSRLENGADLAVASRHVRGGGVQGWPRYRRWGSRLAILLARPITPVKDATTGYFCFKRSILDGVSLDALGFKIGLEIFVKGRHARWEEVPYIFRDRFSGKSKLGQKVIFQYLKHLMKLYAWRVKRVWPPATRPA